MAKFQPQATATAPSSPIKGDPTHPINIRKQQLTHQVSRNNDSGIIHPVSYLPESAPKEQVVTTITPESLKTKEEPTNNASVAILQMQQAMIQFVRDMLSHPIMDKHDRYNEHEEYLNGSDSFLNFLVTNYANKVKPSTGKQFVNVDLKQPERIETSKSNDSLRGMLMSINRLGTFSSENRPDGIWGPRTNNSLKEIFSIAFALMQLVQDMKLPLQDYSKEDMSIFKSNIPKDPNLESAQSLESKANNLTSEINKLRKFYFYVKGLIFDNQNYKEQIIQQKPLYTFEKPEKLESKITSIDNNLYDMYKSEPLTVSLNDVSVDIMPYNMKDMEKFKTWLLAHKNNIPSEDIDAIKNNNKLIINKYLLQVSNSLGKE